MKALLHLLSGLVRAAALLIAGACALALVLAQGGRFSDRLDILTHFTPWLLIGSLAGLALWGLTGRRGRLTPVLSLVGALSALVLMGPEVLAAAGQPRGPVEGPTLKIIQFNLWGRNRDPDSTARWILEENPDVIVFEEGFARSGGVAQALAGRYPHRTTCAEPLACSTMILSKRAPVAEGGLQAGVSDANLSGAWATFRGSRGTYTVVGVHYTWPLPAGPQQQQTLRLSRVLDRFPKKSLVVAGDFNSTPWSFSLRRQDRLFGIERRTRALFTWPAGRFSRLDFKAPFPVLAIDQVYAGSDWKTVEVRRGPALGSDHYPVVVDLARP